jgi:phytoene dehydrogenase-like protein
MLDALVIGSGPNGLSAAIVLAEHGFTVRVYEAEQTIGGGARSFELTEPGFVHDLCSSVYPLALSSPLFRRLPLGDHGLTWVHPEIPLAHPLDHGETVILHRSIDETADGLNEDGPAYRKLIRPLADDWLGTLAADVLAPPHVPWRPAPMLRLAVRAGWPASGAARTLFRTERARALIAGIAAHSSLRLGHAGTLGFALVLGAAAHAVGWPFARGGAQRLTDALASYFRSRGGEIVTGTRVDSLAALPASRVVLCDTPPAEVARIARDRMTPHAAAKWRQHRYGPGVFKIDWALHRPVPWADPACRRAGTLHIGGRLADIERAERAAWEGHHHPSPSIIFAQPSLWDDSRAPGGSHTAWAYCRVPHGSTEEMTDPIERHIERLAPGFRDVIRARHTATAAQMQEHNANLIGGSILAGISDLRWTAPRWIARPYATPARGVFICSASTPPGPSVHGMCGYYAAREAMKLLRRG